MSNSNILQLKSSDSDVAMTLSKLDRDYFHVSIAAHDHSASCRVYAYKDGPALAQLFAEAAREWKGWDGTKVWESLEDELRVELSIDRLGHVTMRVNVRSDQGGPDPWQHSAQIALEAGQLESIARRAAELWL